MKKRILIAALVLITASPSSAQEEIVVHVQPTSTLTLAQEQELLAAATFGSRFYESGDFPAALEQFRAAEKLVPAHPAVLFNLAVVLARMGRYDDAQIKVHTYRALYPDGEEIPQVLELQVDLDWVRELKKRSDIERAYLGLFASGRSAFEAGDYRRAADAFRQAQSTRPADSPAAFNQAVSLEAIGDYEGAIALLASIDTPAVDRSLIDSRIALLQAEIADSKSHTVCGFCGRKLPSSGGHCPDCGRGPFLPSSPQWNTRSCSPGAEARRTMYLVNEQLHGSEQLSCLHPGTWEAALRYSSPKRRSIVAARTVDGWTYRENRISAFRAGEETIELVKERDRLSRILSPSSGWVLDISGQSQNDGRWLVTAEDRLIDGQQFQKRTEYDAAGRITREHVSYQGANSCGNMIDIRAEWAWDGERLNSIALSGGYEGYATEGSPVTQWTGKVNFTYSADGRLQIEELGIERFEKRYTKLPRDLKRVLEPHYPGIRRDEQIDLLPGGDVCGTPGGTPVRNPIDLRAFDAWSPNLAVLLPTGVSRISVRFAYPGQN